jgi:hypothetical protein
MPKGKRTARRDDTDFTQYAEGGQVWDTPNPNKKSKELSSIKKGMAKSRARKAGRPYPNLIDNMWATRDA